MRCKAVLESSAAACVECGTKLGESTGAATAAVPPARNIFSYREHEHGRDFNVNFSDQTMQSVGDVLGSFFASRGIITPRGTFQPAAKIEAEDRQLPPPPVVQPQTPAISQDGNLAQIAKIFRRKGDGLELIDNRVKAKTGMDFVRRLTYVFLYAHELNERHSTSKASVIAILKDGKVWDGNSSKWLASKERLRPTAVGDDEHLELIATSRDEAKKVLADFLNDSVKDEWNPDTRIKQKRAKKKKS